MAKELFPENLSFEEVLASVAGGVLVQSRHLPETKLALEPTQQTDRLELKPNPEYLVDVYV
jgi:hypothetical protein